MSNQQLEPDFGSSIEEIGGGHDQDLALAQEAAWALALAHAQKKFGRRWFSFKLPLVWQVGGVNYNQADDRFEIAISCHPVRDERNRGVLTYHVSSDGKKILPGTPQLPTPWKWKPKPLWSDTWKSALVLAVVVVSAIYFVGCGGEEGRGGGTGPAPGPTPKPPPAATPTPSPPPSPAQATPPALTPPSASASAPPPTTIPTPTIDPSLAGYLLGAEHGLALVQTTLSPSTTQAGWVDVTLDLVITKLGPDPMAVSRIGIKVQSQAICFATDTSSNDCLSVVWGSEGQFEAELRPNRSMDEVWWPTHMAIPYPVTFAVAANATKASLFFAEHRVPLDLQADQEPSPEAREPVPAPMPDPNPAGPTGTGAYFTGNEHGISITGLSRRQSDRFPTWARITLEIVATTFANDSILAPPIKIRSGQNRICFIGENGDDCISIKWGPEQQFHAPLSSPLFDVEWPRGKGWPGLQIDFEVPASTEKAVLLFGKHRIQLDTFGMAGSVPAWDYRLHYPDLDVGSTLYNVNSKKVTFSALEHDDRTGAVTLVFTASNGSAATDFSPRVEARAARVSQEGFVFDGVADPQAGWVPVRAVAQGNRLAPGKEGKFRLALPRTFGEFFPLVAYSDDPPDAVLLELILSDGLSDVGASGVAPALVAFKHYDDELRFWEQLAGQELWSYGIDDDGYMASSPAVSGGMVYVGGNDGNLYALGAATGSLLWKYKTGADVDSSPVVSGGMVYVGSDDNNVYALDAVSGSLIWKYETGGDVNSSPAVSGGVVYVGSGDGNLYALGATKGELIWKYQTKLSVFLLGGEVNSSPAISGGMVYVGSTSGTLFALDATTGRYIWSNRNAIDVSSSPAVSGGVVYIGAADDNLYALEAGSGKLIWKYKTGAEVYSSPTVSGDVVYVGSRDGSLYALDAATGDLIWEYTSKFSRFAVAEEVNSSPAVSGGVAYVGSRDGNLYALDAATGKLIWEYEVGVDIDSSPIVFGGVVYVGVGNSLSSTERSVVALMGSPVRGAARPGGTPPLVALNDAGVSTHTTYKVLFPYREPDTTAERFIFEHNDIVKYMAWLRGEHNINLKHLVSRAITLGDFEALSSALGMEGGGSPYVPWEDEGTYRMSNPGSGTYVPANPTYFQEDTSGQLHPILDVSLEGLVKP